MVIVFSSDKGAEIAAVRRLLAAAGIDSYVGRGEIGGQIKVYWLARRTRWDWGVYVADDIAAHAARDLVRRYQAGELPIPSAPVWRCEQCGATIDGAFTDCWNCQLDDELRDPRQNPEARCTHCGYPLWGLPDLRCPECGQAFDLAGDADEDED